MFDEKMSLNNIIINFESVLLIEYDEQSVDVIVDRTIRLLEDHYNVNFNKTITELQAENQLTADTLNKLVTDIGVCIEKLTFYTMLKYYHKNLVLSLSDVNYLGMGKKDLITALQYMMDVDYQKRYKDQVLQTISLALNNIPICPIKRLFIIILVMDKLGVDEGISCIANLLYMGGLQV